MRRETPPHTEFVRRHARGFPMWRGVWLAKLVDDLEIVEAAMTGMFCIHETPIGDRCPQCEQKAAEQKAEAIARYNARLETGRIVPPTEPHSDLASMLAERGARYGRFEDHARIAQALQHTLWREFERRGVSLKPFQQEAIGMICHKLGRIANGDPDYVDSWDDIAGYATLVSKILRGEGV